jgi:hypothetical protein
VRVRVRECINERIGIDSVTNASDEYIRLHLLLGTVQSLSARYKETVPLLCPLFCAAHGASFRTVTFLKRHRSPLPPIVTDMTLDRPATVIGRQAAPLPLNVIVEVRRVSLSLRSPAVQSQSRQTAGSLANPPVAGRSIGVRVLVGALRVPKRATRGARGGFQTRRLRTDRGVRSSYGRFPAVTAAAAAAAGAVASRRPLAGISRSFDGRILTSRGSGDAAR